MLVKQNNAFSVVFKIKCCIILPSFYSRWWPFPSLPFSKNSVSYCLPHCLPAPENSLAVPFQSDFYYAVSQNSLIEGMVCTSDGAFSSLLFSEIFPFNISEISTCLVLVIYVSPSWLFPSGWVWLGVCRADWNWLYFPNKCTSLAEQLPLLPALMLSLQQFSEFFYQGLC